MNELLKPKLIDCATHLDGRGALGVIEGDQLPFSIKRIYYLYDTPKDIVRGEHGHKKLEQIMISMHGMCDVTLNDGTNEYHFHLDSPKVGLYVPPGMWRSIKFGAQQSILCVLASRPYEVEDYLYTFEDFSAWALNKDSD
ncbi:FdtA/QdtA family cupin domain-containing protein [Shimia sp. SDUM112013]|uniref:sugar 3,4-ketoisomerase n=1 Tax=Shimia sp. SDUM112013 TaxID=3136160 RepID=UPI0032ED24F7